MHTAHSTLNPEVADVSYESLCESQQPEAGKAVRDLLDRIASKWALLVIYSQRCDTVPCLNASLASHSAC